MNIFKCLYVNAYTFYIVPKAYTKYIWLCIKRGRPPEYEMLVKFVVIKKVAKELGVTRKSKVEQSTLKEKHSVTYNKLIVH